MMTPATNIANPLLMFGPGGDYSTRYHVKGLSLARQVGSTLHTQSDTETAGSFAGYQRQPGRQSQQQQAYASPDHRSDVVAVSADGDAYEHGQVISPQSYGTAAQRGSAKGQTAAPSIASATAASAAEAWLAAQQRTLIAIPLFTPDAAASGQPQQRPIGAAGHKPVTSESTGRTPVVPRRRIPLLAATEMQRPASPQAYRTAAAAWPRIIAAVSAPQLRQWTPEDDSHNGADQQQFVTQMQDGSTHASNLNHEESNHESHPETTSYSHPYSRPASGAGLLTDDAGTGRRIERQQGHRLRARRGAHQKGSALARPQQGTLFNC